MNLRTIKKLSKRAADILPLLGDSREQFRAVKNDNYLSLVVKDRKHWQRSRLKHEPIRFGEFDIIKIPKDGKGGYIRISPPDHPRKGTVMIGGMSGYYEPEWSEETTWCALVNLVYWWDIDVDDQGNMIGKRDRLKHPRDFFKAARKMVADVKEKELARARLQENRRLDRGSS